MVARAFVADPAFAGFGMEKSGFTGASGTYNASHALPAAPGAHVIEQRSRQLNAIYDKRVLNDKERAALQARIEQKEREEAAARKR